MLHITPQYVFLVEIPLRWYFAHNTIVCEKNTTQNTTELGSDSGYGPYISKQRHPHPNNNTDARIHRIHVLIGQYISLEQPTIHWVDFS